MSGILGLKPVHYPLLAFPFLAIGAVGSTYFAHLPGQTAMAIIFNITMAIPAFFGLYLASGAKSAALALLALSVFAFAIESLAVATGFPYAVFSYGPNLGPKLFELVPVTLPFSWIPIVLGSWVWAKHLVSSGSEWKRISVAVLLMVAFDLVLDPGAVSLGYWTWVEPGEYYGIPEQNFLGWLLSSTLAQLILMRCCPNRESLPWFVTYPMIWGLFFWSTVALISGRVALVLWAMILLIDWFQRHLKNEK